MNMLTKTIRILKAESRSYKDKEGNEKFFNSVSALVDDELQEMQATKKLTDYIIKNKAIIFNAEIEAELKPRGYELTTLSESEPR